jgi:hypothetical protein
MLGFFVGVGVGGVGARGAEELFSFSFACVRAWASARVGWSFGR